MDLHLAMVFAKDLPRMTAFYRDGVGLTLVADRSTADWSEFQAGGALFALHAIPPAIARDIEITDPPRARGDGALKLVFRVDDLAAARAHLAAHGAVMFEPWSPRACDGLDPEGNVFQIVQR